MGTCVEIPTIFQNTDDFRFLKVEPNGKKAIEKGWQKDKNYSITDESFLKWLARMGNYGIMPFGDICILDVDEPDMLNLDIFSNTFTVKTGGGGYHYFFRCPELVKLAGAKKYPLHIDKKHVGEIFVAGCPAYVVGPSSMHQSGNRYIVYHNAGKIEHMSLDDLQTHILSKCKSSIPTPLTRSIPTDAYTSTTETFTSALELRVEDICMPLNALKQSNGEWQGTHPLHGSTTGMNFSISTSRNMWHCFRCNGGGDPLSFLAIEEGLVTCEDVCSGRVKIEGDLFEQVKKILGTRGYAKQICDLDDVYHREARDKKRQAGGIVQSPIQHTPLALQYKSGLDSNNFIEDYVRVISSTTDAYSEYHYASAMMIVSTLMHRRGVVRMQQGDIYSNLWLFCLGQSTTSRKTTALKKASGFISEVAPSRALPESFSPEGLVEELSENPRGWLIIDEAGSLLASMKKQYMADIRDLFCRLYENDNFTRKLRRGQRKTSATFQIESPYITQLYATTNGNFREYSQTIDLTSGWLLRFLYFSPGYRKQSKAFEPISPKLKQELALLRQTILNLFMLFQSGDGKSEIEFVFSKAALLHLQDWQMRIEDQIDRHGNQTEQAIFGRLVTYAVKLSMVFFVSSGGFMKHMKSLKNTIPDTGLVIEINEKYIVEATHQAENYFMPSAVDVISDVSRNEETNLQNKIIGVLKRNNGRCTKTTVLRTLHVKLKDVDDAFEALTASHEIVEEIVPPQGGGGRGRKSKWVVLVGGDHISEYRGGT